MPGPASPDQGAPALAGGDAAPLRVPVLLDLAALLLRLLEPLLLLATGIALQIVLDTRADPAPEPLYARAAILGAVLYAGLAEAIGAYDVDVRFSPRRAIGRVLTALFATAMLVIMAGFFLKVSEDYSRLWAVGWFAASAATVSAGRLGVTWWIMGKKRDGLFNLRVAIFGAGEQGQRLARYIEGHDRLTIDLVGFFDDRGPERAGAKPRASGLPMCGGLEALIAMVRAGHVDQVIIALPWSAEQRLQEIVAALAVTPVRIRLAPDLASFAFAQRPIMLLGDLPVMALFDRPISGLDSLVKRIEDLILLAFILPFALPIMLCAAIAIKLDSPGPIFFRQDREGFNNRRFAIWKFRSMQVDQLEYDAIHQASRHDPRITRIGRILRATSIDELPQLINVVRGDMSIVGPRPHAPSTRAGSRLFGEIVGTYAARHNVKPGLTGWAQVKGWRGETDTEEKLIRRLEHDLHYIEHWSMGFDIIILLRTIWAVMAPRNAY